MTHNSNHPAGHGTTLPVYHPAPAHSHTSKGSGMDNIPGRSSVGPLPNKTAHVQLAAHLGHIGGQHGHISMGSDFDAIPGRSSIGPLPNRTNHVQLAAQVGHLGVQLRSATNMGGSDSTRAHLHAQSIIAELQKELGQIGGRNILSPRLHSLQKELDHALREIRTHG